MFPIYRVRLVHPDPMQTMCFHSRMLRTEADLPQWVADNEASMRAAAAEKGKNPGEFAVSVTLSHYDTWACGWFSHYTFRDRFGDPADVLRDFDDYVDRVQRAQEPYGDGPDSIKAYEADTGKPWICLMGAEDRWRWSGEEMGDRIAPCRCSDCEKAGVWRITH